MHGFDMLDDIVTDKSNKPTSVDMAYYLFWDKGISYEEFKKLPLPYIFRIIKTYNWVKKEEEKELKKARRKR